MYTMIAGIMIKPLGKLLFFLLHALVLAGCSLPAEDKPLNVVVVLVDDMGYGDIAAHGNPILKTPNFDYLYGNSARFTNFAVSPTCAPTRAALMTGCHEFLVGVTHTISPWRQLDTTAVTMAEIFQENGYKTGMFGKWHLGQTENYGPWFRGFDETLTVPGDEQQSHFDPVFLQNEEEKKYKGYREDILFEAAMQFITDQKDSTFFCYIPTYSPHTPNSVPEKYSRPYEGYINPERPAGEYRAGFFGQVANIDENLGKLIALVDSLGIAQHTVLVILNDNGGTMGVDTYNAGMRGVKTTVWRGGTRAFSFWRCGDQFPAGDRNLMCGHIDILPTLVDLCDLRVSKKVKEQVQGMSLKPFLENPFVQLEEERMQVHHIGRWSNPAKIKDHKYAGCCVRWGRYVLIRHEPCQDAACETCVTARKRGLDHQRPYYTSNSEHYVLTTPGEWELYNISSDPHQNENLAAIRPHVVKRMSDYYEEWWQEVTLNHM